MDKEIGSNLEGSMDKVKIPSPQTPKLRKSSTASGTNLFAGFAKEKMEKKTKKKLIKEEKRRLSLKLSEEAFANRAKLDTFMLIHPAKRRPGTTWIYYDLNPSKTAERRDIVLFLHGGGLRPEAYFEQLLILAEKYRVIAPCIPSYFNSFDDYIAGIELILDYELIQKVHAYGISFGGMIAQYFLYRRPNRVLSLVLYHAAPPNDELGKLFRKYSRKEKIDHTPAILLHYFTGFHIKHKEIDADAASEPEKDFWGSVLKNFGTTNKDDIIPRFEACAKYHIDTTYKTDDFILWKGQVLILDCDQDEKIDGSNPPEDIKKLHPKNSQLVIFLNSTFMHSLIKGKFMIETVMKFYQELEEKEREGKEKEKEREREKEKEKPKEVS